MPLSISSPVPPDPWAWRSSINREPPAPFSYNQNPSTMPTQQIKGSKRYRDAASKVDPDKTYSVEEASALLNTLPKAKFDETVELYSHLTVDPRKSDQMVRGTLKLPHGSGKSVRVIVFTENPDEATSAGADEAGLDDLIEKVSSGWTDFDVALATTSAMKSVRKVARVLGPRGLMPNPKSGTVTDDIPAREDWQSMVDLRDALAIHPWRELDRYQTRSFVDGTVAFCWGDPTESLADIGQETGGDCADDSSLANRGMPEGPGDLLGQLDQGGPADCTTCLDGIDNNCDGFIDCEDPACAACFVGQGAGCSSDSPCAGGGCAVASPPDKKGRRAALVGLLWLGAVLARRRERR